VAHRLNSFIHQSHILPSEQFSFCKQHSAVSHLSRIVNFITHGFNLRKHTGIVLLDITFGLNGLLFKLISLHFLDFLLFLLLGRSYLYCSPERLSPAQNLCPPVYLRMLYYRLHYSPFIFLTFHTLASPFTQMTLPFYLSPGNLILYPVNSVMLYDLTVIHHYVETLIKYPQN